MLKKLLIISILSFSAVSQAKVSIYKLLEKGASFQEIQTAIEQGSDVNEIRLFWDLTPLMYAVEKKRLEIVNLLLQSGANINSRSLNHTTALMYAVAVLKTGVKEDLEIVKLLLEQGANVNAKNKSGGTALMHASFYGHSNIVRLLLAYGADVNASDKDGETALTKAYDKWDFFSRVPKEDYQGTIKALLGAGATE